MSSEKSKALTPAVKSAKAKMDNNQNWAEWLRKLPTWISASIGLVTLIISFIVLILKNVYLGITVTSALILFAGIGLCIYLIFSKKGSEIIGGRSIYRFPKYRRLAIVSAILLFMISAGLLLNRTSRSFATAAFLGTTTPTPMNTQTLTPTPIPTFTPSLTLTTTITPVQIMTPVPDAASLPNELSITGIIVAEAAKNFRVEVTALNSLEQEIFVNHVVISNTYSLGMMCSPTVPAYHYVLEDEIIITSAKSDEVSFQAPIASGNEELAGYKYPAQGSAISYCGWEEIVFSFDTSVILGARSYTALFIDIPKILKVTGAEESRLSDDSSKWIAKPFDKNELEVMLIPNPDDYDYYEFFDITMELITNIRPITLTKHFIEGDK